MAGTAPVEGGPGFGGRPVALGAGLLLGAEALLLLAALPVVALMFLGSLWEGGDAALKQRMLDWGLLAGLGNMAGVAVFGVAAATVLRHKPGQRATAVFCAVLLSVLSLGWAWVFQGHLVSEPSALGEWAVLTVPGLLGSALAVAGAPPV